MSDPENKELDGVLECPICFDLIKTAMIIQQCSHTFCSLCIRRFLSRTNKCPVCKEVATETDLLNCRLVDEVIDKYKSTRNKVSQKKENIPKNSSKEMEISIEESEEENTSFVEKVENLCKTTNMYRRLRRSVGKSPVSDCPPTPTLTGINVKNVEKYGNLSGSKTSKKQKSQDKSLSDDVRNENDGLEDNMDTMSTSCTEEESTLNDHLKTPDNIVVPCPVCQLNVKGSAMNKHLDFCLERDQRRNGLRCSTEKSEKRKPMTKLVYNLLSEKELKKKLKECGLSVHGTREELTKRHQQFTLAYNAECDSLIPKTVEEIIKDVEKMEKLSKTKNPLTKYQSLNVNKNSSSGEVNKAQKSYLKRHKSQFGSLVEMIRDKKQSKKQTNQSENCEVPVDQIESTSSNKENQPHSHQSRLIRQRTSSTAAPVVVELSSLNKGSPSPNLSKAQSYSPKIDLGKMCNNNQNVEIVDLSFNDINDIDRNRKRTRSSTITKEYCLGKKRKGVDGTKFYEKVEIVDIDMASEYSQGDEGVNQKSIYNSETRARRSTLSKRRSQDPENESNVNVMDVDKCCNTETSHDSMTSSESAVRKTYPSRRSSKRFTDHNETCEEENISASDINEFDVKLPRRKSVRHNKLQDKYTTPSDIRKSVNETSSVRTALNEENCESNLSRNENEIPHRRSIRHSKLQHENSSLPSDGEENVNTGIMVRKASNKEHGKSMSKRNESEDEMPRRRSIRHSKLQHENTSPLNDIEQTEQPSNQKHGEDDLSTTNRKCKDKTPRRKSIRFQESKLNEENTCTSPPNNPKMSENKRMSLRKALNQEHSQEDVPTLNTNEPMDNKTPRRRSVRFLQSKLEGENTRPQNYMEITVNERTSMRDASNQELRKEDNMTETSDNEESINTKKSDNSNRMSLRSPRRSHKNNDANKSEKTVRNKSPEERSQRRSLRLSVGGLNTENESMNIDNVSDETVDMKSAEKNVRRRSLRHSDQNLCKMNVSERKYHRKSDLNIDGSDVVVNSHKNYNQNLKKIDSTSDLVLDDKICTGRNSGARRSTRLSLSEKQNNDQYDKYDRGANLRSSRLSHVLDKGRKSTKNKSRSNQTLSKKLSKKNMFELSDLDDVFVISDPESESEPSFPNTCMSSELEASIPNKTLDNLKQMDGEVNKDSLNCIQGKSVQNVAEKENTHSESINKSNDMYEKSSSTDSSIPVDAKQSSNNAKRDRSTEVVVRIQRLSDEMFTNLSLNNEGRCIRKRTSPSKGDNNIVDDDRSGKDNVINSESETLNKPEKNKKLSRVSIKCDKKSANVSNYKENHVCRTAKLLSLKTCRQSRSKSRNVVVGKMQGGHPRKFYYKQFKPDINNKQGEKFGNYGNIFDNTAPPILSNVNEITESEDEGKYRCSEPPELIDMSNTSSTVSPNQHVETSSPGSLFLENIYLGRQLQTNLYVEDGGREMEDEIISENFQPEEQNFVISSNYPSDKQNFQNDILNEKQILSHCLGSEAECGIKLKLSENIFETKEQLPVNESVVISSVQTSLIDHPTAEVVVNGGEADDKSSPLPIPVFYNDPDDLECDVLQNAINSTIEDLMSDEDEDNDPIHKIWPALSQQIKESLVMFETQPGITGNQCDRQRHCSGVSNPLDHSIPLYTPERCRHTSGLSDRLGDFSGNSTMSVVIPYTGQVRVVNSAAKRCLESENYSRSCPTSPVTSNKRRRDLSLDTCSSKTDDDLIGSKRSKYDENKTQR